VCRQFVYVGHEVSNGGYADHIYLLEWVYVGDAFLVVYDDIFVLDTNKLVAIFEEPVGVVMGTFTFLHGHPCVVVSIVGL
jgi:hypothetical protein